MGSSIQDRIRLREDMETTSLPSLLTITLLLGFSLGSQVGSALKELEECECGVPNYERIPGAGKKAGQIMVPWQVTLKLMHHFYGSSMAASCRGTLISNKHVLTSDNCTVYNDYDFAVEIGGKSYFVEKINIRDETTTGGEKLIVLVLEKSVDFSLLPEVRPVCLPKHDSFDNLRGVTALADEWGKYNGPFSQFNIKIAEQDIQSKRGRRVVIRQCGPSSHGKGEPLCATAKTTGSSPCWDPRSSSGPLAVQSQENGGAYTLVGLTLGSDITCQPDGTSSGQQESIRFLDVRPGLSWLQEQLAGGATCKVPRNDR